MFCALLQESTAIMLDIAAIEEARAKSFLSSCHDKLQTIPHCGRCFKVSLKLKKVFAKLCLATVDNMRIKGWTDYAKTVPSATAVGSLELDH